MLIYRLEHSIPIYLANYAIIKGDGKTFPAEGDTLTVHYEGKLAREGTVFDSSYGREAFQFVIGEGQVIKGWDRGIMEMSLGSTNRI